MSPAQILAWTIPPCVTLIVWALCWAATKSYVEIGEDTDRD